jgi:hypothetical protein
MFVKSTIRLTIWWSLVPANIQSSPHTLFYPLLSVKLKSNYDRRLVGKSILVSNSHLEPMTRFLFSAWQLWVSWCEASSLTRRWVCNLLVQLFRGLARAVTLRSKSCRTRDHILLSHLRLLSDLEVQVPVFIFPRNRVAQLHPEQWFYLTCLRFQHAVG